MKWLNYVQLILAINFCSFLSAQENIWEATNTPKGNSSSAFQDIIVDGGNILFAVRSLDVFRSENSGDSWEIVNNGLTVGGLLSIAIDSNGRIWVGTAEGVYQSGDKGETWQTTGLTSGAVLNVVVTSEGNIYAGIIGSPVAGGIAVSTNEGADWEMINSGLPVNIRSYWTIAQDQVGAIYVGTNAGVFRLTSATQNWESIGLENLTTRAIVITETGTVFAGTREAGVFYFDNSSDQWTETNTGLTNTGVIKLAAHRNGDIFAATFGGIFQLPNGEDNWVSLGLTEQVFHAIAIAPDGKLFAGGDDDIYRSIQSVITAVENSADVVDRDFHLYQNYPNPFNPSTVIKYDVAESSSIKIEVFNTLGQKVRTLVNEIKQAGSYETIWDGFNESGEASASSVYIYRMKTSRLEIFKKFLLIR